MTNCKVVPCDLKEGRRGMLYYAINYAAKKYTDKDHPRAARSFFYIITSMFGMDDSGEEINIGDQKTISRYLDFLESFSNLVPSYGSQDRFEAVIRTMMGGKINHVGESPVLYYFTSDDGFKPSREDLEASEEDIADSFYYSDDISFRTDMQVIPVNGFGSKSPNGITDVMKGE